MKRQRRRFSRQPPYGRRTWSHERWALERFSVVGRGYYRLRHSRPVECRTLGEWVRGYGSSLRDRTVAETECADLGYVVSTIFLGIDRGWGLWPRPILFETMIHSIDDNPRFLGYQTRYATRAQAMRGHDMAVAWLRAGGR